MIDSGDIVVDGHNKNSDHQAFKDPFPPHEKGEYSKTKNTNDKVNYTDTNVDNGIGMIKPIEVEYCDVITIKGSGDAPKLNTLSSCIVPRLIHLNLNNLRIVPMLLLDHVEGLF